MVGHPTFAEDLERREERAISDLTTRRAAGRLLLLAVLAVSCLLAPPVARGQTPPPEPAPASSIHWAFGSFLGTGVYGLSQDRGAFVLKIPARWTIGRAALGAEGERRIGLELRFPLTVGVLRADTIAGYIDQTTYGTVSITPGLEAEVLLTQDWALRPYFAIGWGAELGPASAADENQTALIYQAGLKSRYRLPGDIGTWALLGAVQYAGYNPDVGASADLLVVTGGLETRQRFGHLFHGVHPLFIEAHASYGYVTDLPRLRNGYAEPVGFDDFVEVGLAISQGVVPFRILGIPIERYGLAFQLGTDLEYRAIKLSFRSPFRL